MSNGIRVEDYELRRHGATDVELIYETLADAYEAAYAERLDGGFRSRRSFLERLDAHRQRDGFELVGGLQAGTLIGFMYGFTLHPHTEWWSGFEGELPAEIAALTRAGNVFAVAEMVTRPAWQRRGVAHNLHDALVGGRIEAVATLLVDPTNEPALSAYRAWDWELIGFIQPYPDAPRFESRVRWRQR
jgi:ribosomal protein S18 acetylase RimI-like enzyme